MTADDVFPTIVTIKFEIFICIGTCYPDGVLRAAAHVIVDSSRIAVPFVTVYGNLAEYNALGGPELDAGGANLGSRLPT